MKPLAKVVEHDKAFSPSVRGHGDPLGRYPEFINKNTSQEVPVEKLKKVPSNPDQPTWRYNNAGYS